MAAQGTVLNYGVGSRQRMVGLPPNIFIAHALDPRFKNHLPGVPPVERGKLWSMVEAALQKSIARNEEIAALRRSKAAAKAAAGKTAKAAEAAARPTGAAASSVVTVDDSDAADSEPDLDESAADGLGSAAAAAAARARPRADAAADGGESFMDSIFPTQDDEGGVQDAGWEAAASSETEEEAVERRRVQASEELRRYQRLPMLGKDENPLAWWRNQAAGVQGLPGLAALARSVLCIPATSAPAERLFSEAGLTITAVRATMKAENAECLTFLRGCWHVVEPYTGLAA